MRKVIIIEPCRIDGEHKNIGDEVTLDDGDALSLVGAGRGTIDVEKGKAIAATAKKAEKVDK